MAKRLGAPPTTSTRNRRRQGREVGISGCARPAASAPTTRGCCSPGQRGQPWAGRGGLGSPRAVQARSVLPLFPLSDPCATGSRTVPEGDVGLRWSNPRIPYVVVTGRPVTRVPPTVPTPAPLGQQTHGRRAGTAAGDRVRRGWGAWCRVCRACAARTPPEQLPRTRVCCSPPRGRDGRRLCATAPSWQRRARARAQLRVCGGPRAAGLCRRVQALSASLVHGPPSTHFPPRAGSCPNRTCAVGGQGPGTHREPRADRRPRGSRAFPQPSCAARGRRRRPAQLPRPRGNPGLSLYWKGLAWVSCPPPSSRGACAPVGTASSPGCIRVQFRGRV